MFTNVSMVALLAPLDRFLLNLFCIKLVFVRLAFEGAELFLLLLLLLLL